MPDVAKTVFVSYRRSVSRYIARAVFMDLRAHGYDVFMDVESIDSGTFDTIILNQIAARAHFIVILTPGSVGRCTQPDDWLRREIEHAMDLQRNIVPVLVDSFSFQDAEPYLTGKLSQLKRYNALTISHDFFEEAMDRLRKRFLKQAVYAPITPTPFSEHKAVQRKINKAQAGLGAEQLFDRASEKLRGGDLRGAFRDWVQAILKQ
jgi:hypothetical protein